MKTVNCNLRRVGVVFVLLMLIGHIDVLGNITAGSADNFSITSDNSTNALVWDLKYAASENSFKITVQENNGEKVFTVRNKFFEVAYILNKKGFGARMVGFGKGQVPDQIFDKIINITALEQQKVITDDALTNESALNLIASYLPDLINDNYKQLVR